MKKIVVAIDSFKGCVSSAALAEAVEEAVKEIMPACHVCKIPIADGGEGTVDALIQALQGERVSCRVEDPLRRPIEATYGWVKATRLAIIEMAAASGLPLLRPEERDVMRASTRGVGQLIANAIHRGARHFLLGIGGSATVTEDGLVIEGRAQLSGGTVDAANDHRIAMMAAIDVASAGCRDLTQAVRNYLSKCVQ